MKHHDDGEQQAETAEELVRMTRVRSPDRDGLIVRLSICLHSNRGPNDRAEILACLTDSERDALELYEQRRNVKTTRH